MQPPSVVIAANPYEAELCRRALVETGLRVVVAEGGEGAIEVVRQEKPLVLVIALGIGGCDAMELLHLMRNEQPRLSIFVIGDRDGELPDEDAAQREGATRLFLRPIEIEALADAIEKRAVEAEVADEVAEAMAEFDARPPTIDAAPLVEEAIVELEADYGDDEEEKPQELARIPLKRVPTEVMKGVIEVPASRAHVEHPADKVEATYELDADEPTPPPTTVMLEPLMRVDDALGDAGLKQLVVAPDFVVTERQSDDAPAPNTDEKAAPAGESFDERSTFARRLDRELSAAERRLFPDSPSTASVRPDEYEDALGDIDLDKIGLDTIPGIGADALDAAFDFKPRNGHANGNGARGGELTAASPATVAPEPPPSLPDDEGDLATTDVATLFARLHGAGFSGMLTLSRGDGDKQLFFDAGVPVAARSTFAHDRLADMLVREGLLTREQHARARDVGPGGRAAVHKLVELGLVKSSELFATLRRHVEEIVYSCFGWERGRYRLKHVEPPTEDRVRLGAHPWALFVEGVRRKYGLERLVELVGPPETVLVPTTLLPRALDDGNFSAAERARAELIDGERTLAELSLGAVGAPLSEAGLYALAWSLVAIGAARLDGDDAATEAAGAVRTVPTLVTSSYGEVERRTRPRPKERARDREVDRAIDKERVIAKRAQVQDGDYFSILGLSRDASAHEVARAFERLKREFAPDRFAPPLRDELADALGEIGEVLDEAHRVLADDAVRASYRAHLPESS